MNRDRDYIMHIIDSLQRIETYAAEGKTAYEASQKTQDAIIRNLTIIGEATKRLSPSFKAAHTEISWRDIAGLRDVIVHDYLYVDPDEIWRVTSNDVPVLLKQLTAILDTLPESEA